MSKYFSAPSIPSKSSRSNTDDINGLSDATETAFNLVENHGTISEKSSLSTETISAGSTVSIIHGLSSRPYLSEIYLECTSAEQGYSIGDKIYPLSCSSFTTADNGGIFPIIPSDTTISFDMASLYPVFRAVNKSGYGVVDLDEGKWSMKIRSYIGGNTSLSYFTKPTAVSGTSDITDFNDLSDVTDTAFTSLKTDVDSGTYFTNVLTKSYTSTNQTITAGSTITLTHGMSTLPILITTHLVCIGADLGYSIGHEINLSAQQGCMGINQRPEAGGFTIEADSTNIKIHIANIDSGNSIGVTDLSQLPSFLTRSYIDNTKWKIKVNAWA
jgi:hypothetical protein